MEVLQIILSETKEHSEVQNVQLCTCLRLWTIQLEKSESKSKKWRSCLIQSELDTYGSWYCTWTTQILKHGHEDSDPLSSLLHTFQGKFGNALSNNIMKYMQMTQLMDKAQKFIWHTFDEPENSSYIHVWWIQMKIMMNTIIFWSILKNTTTLWSTLL